ncbi:MAG: ATP synthase subunit delta [Candidatus Tokpelaia hoelldobleri]|uniref:ATP synthase subunit delta n=1 Tax=Candidatus Tokpelaia hoelldobleri TaxID=1902579 RepID=A0A1U9JT55_9HYPH|nr:MAG: ATP synthase subunit delta [Candidatus Tokpelaia hoelldoblerii]
MVEISSPMSPVVLRYAGSLYELAVGSRCVDSVGKQLANIAEMLEMSADLRSLVSSSAFSSDVQFRAINALLEKSGADTGKGGGLLVGNFLRVVAKGQRLSLLAEMIAAFHHLAAKARGEETADVVCAHALDKAQEKELKTVLSKQIGKDVDLRVTVDPAILGGLIVRVGSQQIDTSLRTRLSSLKIALKEVG